MAVEGVGTDIRALVADEQRCWGEFQALLALLSPEQAERPGYFPEGWSAKDLLAHVAGWLAEAGQVLEQVRVGTFTGRDEVGVPPGQGMDIEGRNAVFLDANRSQPLRVVHAEAYAARTRLLQEVGQLVGVTAVADVWLRKAGPEHYAEHLPRLREWVRELSVGPLDVDGADGARRRRVEEDLPGILDHVLQHGIPAIPAKDGHDDDLVLLVVADEREWQPFGFHPAAEFRRHHLDRHRLALELLGHAVQEPPPLLAHGLAHLLAHPMSPSRRAPLSSPAPAAYPAGRFPAFCRSEKSVVC